MKTVHDLVAEAKLHIQETPLANADEAIQNADLLIDVRDGDEYRQSHIPHAMNISRGLLEFKFSNDPTLDNRGLDIVLYCKNSGRSALADKSSGRPWRGALLRYTAPRNPRDLPGSDPARRTAPTCRASARHHAAPGRPVAGTCRR